MLLTQSWVNAVSIAVVVASLWRLWHSSHARRAADPLAAKQPVSSADAYLLLEHTRANRAEIERSDVCGCIYCEQLFRPAEIAGWAGETAVCPRCGRKMVVGSGAGIPLTHELLHRSHTVGTQEHVDGQAS